MYQLNTLQRNVLITPLEVIFHAPISHTLDELTIRHSIIIAEERFISSTLGLEFYLDICSEKNRVVTSGNVVELQALLTASAVPAGSAKTLVPGDVVNALEFLSTDYKTLWKQYLWKLVAECVMLTATPENFVQFTSTGIAHKIPTASPMITAGAISPDLRSVKWAMDQKQLSRIDPLMEAIHSYICLYKAKYPKYLLCPCDEDTTLKGRRTDIIMGLYDDDKAPCCDWTLP